MRIRLDREHEEVLLQFDGSASKQFVASLMELLETPVESGGGPGVKPDDATVTVQKGGPRRITHPTMGFTALVSVEVLSPLVVEGAAETYVVYAVRSSVRMLGLKEPREWLVHHRYSDFEALDDALRKKVAENMDSLHVLLPVMPSKPWVPVGQFGQDWLQSRCRKLNRFMLALAKLPELLKQPQYLVWGGEGAVARGALSAEPQELLLRFLSDGEYHQLSAQQEPVNKGADGNGSGNWCGCVGGGPRHVCGATQRGIRALFEKGMYGVNAALAAMLDKREIPTPIQDYEYVHDMFLKQGLVPKTVRVWRWRCWSLWLRLTGAIAGAVEEVCGDRAGHHLVRQVVVHLPSVHGGLRCILR